MLSILKIQNDVKEFFKKREENDVTGKLFWLYNGNQEGWGWIMRKL